MQCLSYVVSRDSPTPRVSKVQIPVCTSTSFLAEIIGAQFQQRNIALNRRHVKESQTCIRSILILPQEAAPRPRVTSQHQHVCAQASIIAELATHGFLSHNALQDSISCPSRFGPIVMSCGRPTSIENTPRVFEQLTKAERSHAGRKVWMTSVVLESPTVHILASMVINWS